MRSPQSCLLSAVRVTCALARFLCVGGLHVIRVNPVSCACGCVRVCVKGPSPTVEDMSHVLEFLQLWHAVEPYKAYPREPWVLGRVRVRLVDEDGVPWNPEVPDRECCLMFFCLFLRWCHTLFSLCSSYVSLFICRWLSVSRCLSLSLSLSVSVSLLNFFDITWIGNAEGLFCSTLLVLVFPPLSLERRLRFVHILWLGVVIVLFWQDRLSCCRLY